MKSFLCFYVIHVDFRPKNQRMDPKLVSNIVCYILINLKNGSNRPMKNVIRKDRKTKKRFKDKCEKEISDWLTQ